ncbi:hypothetical protein LSAT2_020330 [Lamellibrachia satsuma]|nr:hypothetical protein LSAT2_020330 [Lamellibrachia satsuma]
MYAGTRVRCILGLRVTEELEKVRRTTDGELTRLQAALRKKDLQVHSLEQTVDQKTKENEELTKICDELINKVGIQ